MDKVRIENIIEELKHRTAWGVFTDFSELVEAKKEAEFLIRIIDDAIYDIERFVKDYMKDSETPDKEETEE